MCRHCHFSPKMAPKRVALCVYATAKKGVCSTLSERGLIKTLTPRQQGMPVARSLFSHIHSALVMNLISIGNNRIIERRHHAAHSTASAAKAWRWLSLLFLVLLRFRHQCVKLGFLGSISDFEILGAHVPRTWGGNAFLTGSRGWFNLFTRLQAVWLVIGGMVRSPFKEKKSTSPYSKMDTHEMDSIIKPISFLWNMHQDLPLVSATYRSIQPSDSLEFEGFKNGSSFCRSNSKSRLAMVLWPAQEYQRALGSDQERVQAIRHD
ncbi:hypothetical protein EMPG_12428 [Blastomyces silverae]|uniref:Uncharacterized protein n=1 Tax=Blastomyces silverae TaxID=2060906 RepID=A0A0H1BNF7_9EURO|nr:hypothetical protein EMPG_12428 [Blastomyces silverae]